MKRTSLTDPLRIASVTPAGTTGSIGMTLCPGRQGTSISVGSWNRDLALDLDVIRAWNPDIVLALLEDHEFGWLGIPQFREAVVEAGLPWEFLPIRDGDVPDARFTRAWEEAGPRVRSVLRRGGRVLIHCRAGLGRTGMVAAGILVELGAEPEAAIDTVRAARPGAIETPEQAAYVRAWALMPGAKNDITA